MLGGMLIAALSLGLAIGARPGARAGKAREAAPHADRQQGLCFVQITDTHFGPADHAERTARVVEAINRLPMDVDCVVHTGDIFSDNIADERAIAQHRRTLSKLKAPVHRVAGNHDIVRKRARLAETTAHYRKQIDPNLSTRAEYNGVVLLMVYTEPLARGFEQEGYDALAWLERELRSLDGKPAIVFHHTPSVRDFYRNRMHPGWPRDVRDKWVALLNRYGVQAVIAGHFHRDEHHWLGDVPLYVSAPVAGYWGRQTTYRIYEYRDGKVSYRTQYIGE
jgi:predicted MPP superfamily phosphohydrolase